MIFAIFKNTSLISSRPQYWKITNFEESIITHDLQDKRVFTDVIRKSGFDNRTNTINCASLCKNISFPNNTGKGIIK